MHAILALVAATALGLDQGWEPLAEGGVEFIVQIDPASVEQLVNVQDIISDAPEGLDIRRVRVTVGRAKLNREIPQPKEIVAKPPANETTVPVLGLAALPSMVGHTVQKPTFGKESEPVDEETPRVGPKFPKSAEQYNGYRLTDTAEDRNPPRSTNRLPTPPRLSEDEGNGDRLVDARNTGSGARSTYEKLETQDPKPQASRSDSDRDNQWGSLFLIFFVLMLSLGANFWLGWIAFEARTRYQILLDKYRTQGGKASMELV